VGAPVPDWKTKKAKRRKAAGPGVKAWNYPTAANVIEEIGRAAPAYGEIRWETLGEAGVQWPAAAGTRSSRRVQAVEASPVAAAPNGNFWLVGGPLLWDGGVFMHYSAEQVRNLTPEPFVALNPADAAALNLAEGAAVTVRSDRGSVELMLKTEPSVQPGTAWLPAGLTGAPAETLGAGRGAPVAVTIR
jgi:predicted molibdopterin-dependent oxidoreductase YjgC